MERCCVLGCTNRPERKIENITFHRHSKVKAEGDASHRPGQVSMDQVVKMSVNVQVHLDKNENNKKNDTAIKPLFPKQAECSYVSCYCEENVWKLCQDVSIRIPGELDRCYVVFISNPCRTVPLWKQRAGREEDRLVIWDYHVIFLYSVDSKTCLVYDLDSELPFPTFFHKYVTETFRTDQVLKSDFHRFFRVVPAKQFLQHFASDRRHMKRPDGSWIKPPPPYPAVCTSTATHNLDEYINMDPETGPGQVFNLTDYVQRFYKKDK